MSSVARIVAREPPKRSENSASVRAGAECPLSEVPLYCVSETGRRLLSVLRVREVSVFGGFFVQLLMGIFPDRRKCASYRKCPSLGGVRYWRFHCILLAVPLIGPRIIVSPAIARMRIKGT